MYFSTVLTALVLVTGLCIFGASGRAAPTMVFSSEIVPQSESESQSQSEPVTNNELFTNGAHISKSTKKPSTSMKNKFLAIKLSKFSTTTVAPSALNSALNTDISFESSSASASTSTEDGSSTPKADVNSRVIIPTRRPSNGAGSGSGDVGCPPGVNCFGKK